MSEASEDRSELELELRRVSDELLHREERLKGIEEEVEQLQYKLQAIQESLGIASGDTAKVVMSQKYKRKLSLDVDRKYRFRTQVQEEVERARQRLAQVRELLNEQKVELNPEIGEKG